MSRQRKKTSDRRRQEDRRLSVRGVRRDPPDAAKLSRALIALALAQAQAEADAQQGRAAAPPPPDQDVDQPGVAR
jgi:hypothetical protein